MTFATLCVDEAFCLQFSDSCPIFPLFAEQELSESVISAIVPRIQPVHLYWTKGELELLKGKTDDPDPDPARV